MSPAQTNLYWRKWSACKRALAKLGRPFDDSARHALHAQALGRPKSSKEFTNRDLDKVLAAFASFAAPSDLRAQMRAQEQPTVRREKLQADCRSIVAQLPKVQAAEEPAAYVESYLDSVARSVAGVVFADLDERDLSKLLGILRHRLKREPVPAQGADDLDPFCPW